MSISRGDDRECIKQRVFRSISRCLVREAAARYILYAAPRSRGEAGAPRDVDEVDDDCGGQEGDELFFGRRKVEDDEIFFGAAAVVD